MAEATAKSDDLATDSTEMDNLMAKNCSADSARGIPEVKTQSTSERNGAQKLIVGLIVFLGIVCLVVGIILLFLAKSKAQECEREVNVTCKYLQNGTALFAKSCSLSEEAQRVGLNEFISKVRTKYYELHPNWAMDDLTASAATIRKRFQAYDPSPLALKRKTDAALELFQEINNKTIDVAKLKLREKKALSQIKFFLKHTFGKPYDVNYYNGDWMLGPNFFCWMPICNIPRLLGLNLPYFKPHNLEDLEILRKMLSGYKKTFRQYIKNMKLGVKSGMVRSVEECKAGLNSLKAVYAGVARANATGIRKEPWLSLPGFLSGLTSKMAADWYRAHGKHVEETIGEYWVEYLGKPIQELLSYVEHEHARHCVSSSVSSGLSNRPLPYVYTDGVANLSQPTTQRLPTGEKFSGLDAYDNMLAFFTSTDLTADEVHKKGEEMLAKIYPQIKKLAMEITKLNDSSAAVESFKKKLKSQEMYYNKVPFPQNESTNEAYLKCDSVEGAKKHCPSRWKAITEWFERSQQVMSLLDPKTVDLFYFTGDKHTTPNCPVKLKVDFNPSSAAQSYQTSDPDCKSSCTFNVPFFLNNLGPIYSEFSVNVHEARPGHHTQAQGFLEHFVDRCGGPIAWVNRVTPNVAFGEGWALYAEALMAQDTDVYNGNLLQKFGYYKWQIWRAIRLVVDTGLHAKGFTRQDVLKMFEKYAWDTSDVALKEATRYQSGPGQATSYMIGQLIIQKSRDEAKKKLGKKFDLKEFHYQILSQGSAPVSFLQSHIDDYVNCKLEPTKIGCDSILNPLGDADKEKSRKIVVDGMEVQQPSFTYPYKRYV